MYKSSLSKYDHGCSSSRYDYENAVDSLTNNTCHIYSTIVSSYQELQTDLKLHRNSLAKALKTLEKANLVNRTQIVIKSNDDYNSRADKSLWRISLINASSITNESTIHAQKEPIGYDEQEKRFDKIQSVISTTNILINTYDQKNVVDKNKALKPFVKKRCTKYDPHCTDSGQLYIKDFIVNNSIIKNIDYIDVSCKNLETLAIGNPPNIYTSPCSETLETLSTTKNTVVNHKEEFLEEEQSSSSSKFYENSSFLDVSCRIKGRNISKQREIQKKEQKEEWKELRKFYPLSEKDINLLNSKANREFSNNFVNQLLLKLYIKYPEKRFKNRFTFLSYMAQILSNEKHQGPLVNHTSFRFGCNINEEERNLLEQEKYLNQIEDSLDTSKEIQVRKKIAGRFSTDIAYKILTQVQFRTNHGNSVVTALVPNHLAAILRERQKEALNDQLEAVYGINGYYVQEVKQEEKIEDVKTEGVGSAKGGRERGKSKVVSTGILEKQYSKIKEPDIITNSKNIGSLESSKESEITTENPVWHQIRKGLREELGDAIDEVWFSKAVAAHCNDTKTLTLTMPTRFMSDWIRNNYSHVIRRVAGGIGIDKEKYEY